MVYVRREALYLAVYIRELLLLSMLLVKSIVTITTALVAVSTAPSRSVYSNLNSFLLLYARLPPTRQSCVSVSTGLFQNDSKVVYIVYIRLITRYDVIITYCP